MPLLIILTNLHQRLVTEGAPAALLYVPKSDGVHAVPADASAVDVRGGEAGHSGSIGVTQFPGGLLNEVELNYGCLHALFEFGNHCGFGSGDQKLSRSDGVGARGDDECPLGFFGGDNECVHCVFGSF